MEKDKKENVQWQAALNPLSLPLLFSGALSSMCYLAFNISPSPRICCSPSVLLHPRFLQGSSVDQKVQNEAMCQLLLAKKP